jgi:prepilin signal peptidase PulO-like enzyme (type II secretory pathway)
MRESIWFVVGLLNGWIALLRARREIARVRDTGKTYGEAHLTDSRLAGPVSAVVVALLYLGLVSRFDHDITVLAFGMFVGVCALLAWIDVDTHVIPSRVVARSLVVGVPLLTLASFRDDQGSVFRMIIGALVTWIALRIMEILSRGGLGGGDVTLGALLGAYLGWLSWRSIYDGLFIGFIVGGVFALVLLLTRRVSRDHQFAFGPFLVIGAIVAVLR